MPINNTKTEGSELTIEGRKLYLRYNQMDHKEAKDKFIKAIKIDPSYMDAYGWLAYAMQWEVREGWNLYLRADADLIFELAHQGVELDLTSYYMRWCLADVLSGCGKYDEALNEFGATLALNPAEGEEFDILVEIADVHTRRGNAKEGLRLIEKAKKEREKPPSWYLWSEGLAHFINKDFDKAIVAIDEMEKKVSEAGDNLPSHAILTRVAARERSGSRDADKMEAAFRAIRINSPNWKPEDIARAEPIERPEDRELWLGSFKQLSRIALDQGP
jgi:tetratricopeptide (TPR) repeat protein